MALRHAAAGETMKRKRHCVIDPAKARAAAGGGLAFIPPTPLPRKYCGRCEQPRCTVNDADVCGY